MEQFYTLLTETGKAKIANATALQTKVNFTKLLVGDSGGSYYEPTETQTKLKNKVWEGGIGNISVDKDNPNWIVLESVIPSSVGGFTIREIGIVDEDGDLVVIAKYPATYKPQISDGSTKDLIIKTILEVTNASSVTLKVDPTIVLATKKDIENAKKEVTESTLSKEDIETTINNIKASDIKTSSGVTVEAQLAEKTTVLTASGTANAITLNVTLEDKGRYSFKATANSTGAVTINGIALKKTDGTAVSNLKTNKVYDFYYDKAQNSVFILAKAEGDALVGDVLAGKIFSNGDDTGLIGTLDLSKLTPGNIKENITINNVTGTLKPFLNPIRTKELTSLSLPGTLYEIDSEYCWKLKGGNNGSFLKYRLNGTLIYEIKFTDSNIPKGFDYYTNEFLAYTNNRLLVFDKALTLLRTIPYDFSNNADIVYTTESCYLFIVPQAVYVGDKNGTLKSKMIYFDGYGVVAKRISNHEFLCTTGHGTNKIINDDGSYTNLLSVDNPILLF